MRKKYILTAAISLTLALTAAGCSDNSNTAASQESQTDAAGTQSSAESSAGETDEAQNNNSGTDAGESDSEGSTAQADSAAGEETTDGTDSQTDTSAESGQETAADGTDTASSNTSTEGSSNILIAYFTAGENSDVDVVSSASVTTIDGEAKGRLRAVADMIQSETGGDLFSIQTEVAYPGDGGELIDYAAQEQDEDARPVLTSHIDNLDNYDTIFVGYPTWWYDMPQALYSFFDEYDFSGKTIIPFNVHNGSQFSGTIETIQELEPDAQVLEEGFTVNENDVADAQGDVTEWLEGLGY